MKKEQDFTRKSHKSTYYTELNEEFMHNTKVILKTSLLQFCHELWQACRLRQDSGIYSDHFPSTAVVWFGGLPYKHILSPPRCLWQSKCVPTSIFFQQLQDFSIDACWDFTRIFLVFSKVWYTFKREKPTTLTIKYSLY